MKVAIRDSTSVACAFFDVDGTIWNDKSILSFYKVLLDYQFNATLANDRWNAFLQRLKAMQLANVPRLELNRWFYREHFNNLPVSLVKTLVHRWWLEKTQQKNFWVVETVSCIRKHQQEGLRLVLVTGSFYEIIQPLMKSLNINEALTAPLEQWNGLYTGRLKSLPVIGEGKAVVVSEYIQRCSVNTALSYAYGDDHTDIFFLKLVKHSFLLKNGIFEPLSAQEKEGI